MSWLDPAFAFWAVSVANLLIAIFDVVVGTLFGRSYRHGTRSAKRLASEEYSCSAQLLSIEARGAYSTIHVIQPRNFVLKHERYVHPNYALEHDNVILMGHTPTHAFFSVSDENENFYDVEKHPFMFMAQFYKSKKLLMMPWKSFNRLASELGDPDTSRRKVALIHMTARCGSTLLLQMCQKVPGVRVMAEPWVFLHIHGYYHQGIISFDTYKEILRSTIRIVAKPSPESINHLIIKFEPSSSLAFPYLKETLPSARVIFNSRHPRPSIQSYVKVSKSQPKIYYYTGGLLLWYLCNFPLPYNEPLWRRRFEKSKLKPSVLTGLGTAGYYYTYFKYKEMYAATILYEDLLSHPAETTRKLFEALELPEEKVPDALFVLEKDSQKGQLANRGEDGIVISQSWWTAIDKVLKEFNSPVSTTMTYEEYKRLFD